MRQLAKIS